MPGAVCALIVGLYVGMAAEGVTEWSGATAAENHYNLLVAGFRTGHLSVDRPVPADFAKLADPYDPAANAEYRSLPIGLHDLSYYKGQGSGERKFMGFDGRLRWRCALRRRPPAL